MKNILSCLCILVLLNVDLSAQRSGLKVINDLSCTEVKSQGNTGTCWSFSTLSFLESEIIRLGFEQVDLSEMYIVRHIYFDKAMNYYLRQGKANFSQGSLSHDVINVIAKYGVLPEQVYPGLKNGSDTHNHTELEQELKDYLDQIIAAKDKSPYWPVEINKILDKHLGAIPRSVNPSEFSSFYGIEPSNYVSFASFKHHPRYESFILEIPDNYSNGTYLNVELAELRAIVDNALSNGYTVSWDGDVSEVGFKAKEGYAILTASEGMSWSGEFRETRVSADLKQDEFMTYKTTDDHLMHIVGKVKDASGKSYYKVKNSWGEIGPFKGYLYMSEAYFDMKTVGIMVHQMAVPDSITSKFQ